MFKYNLIDKISATAIELLGDNYKSEDIEKAQALVVRSTKIKNEQLSEEVLAIARAGAGVNNIPVEECAKKGIVVFNTPGANANGVKELVIAGMLLASRDIIGGINWLKENNGEEIARKAEKEKSRFKGCEIWKKSIGVIGLGAIGSKVANSAAALGMKVYGYDPYISVDTAWQLSQRIIHSTDLSEIYEKCDYITVHVPLLENTKELINKKAI